MMYFRHIFLALVFLFMVFCWVLCVRGDEPGPKLPVVITAKMRAAQATSENKVHTIKGTPVKTVEVKVGDVIRIEVAIEGDETQVRFEWPGASVKSLGADQQVVDEDTTILSTFFLAKVESDEIKITYKALDAEGKSLREVAIKLKVCKCGI